MNYPYADTAGLVGRVLPQTMTVIFKGTKTKTEIARGRLLNMQIVSDESDQSIEMRLDFGDKDYYCILSEADLKKLLISQPIYEVKSSGKQDSVQGLWASEYTVKEKNGDHTHSNAWFTEALRPEDAYFYSSYRGVKGFPLIYEVERYNVVMKATVTKFIEREVTEEFMRNPGSWEVSFDEYEEDLQELFDVLMDNY